MIFLEKLNHQNRREYKRREDIKDVLYKSIYFTTVQQQEKRRYFLNEMENGQIDLTSLLMAIKVIFLSLTLSGIARTFMRLPRPTVQNNWPYLYLCLTPHMYLSHSRVSFQWLECCDAPLVLANAVQ